MTTKRSRGIEGERAAATFLKQRGYKILEANFQTRWGEIDLIAEDGPTLVFVEVKARMSHQFGSPADAITPAKQVKIARMAQLYMAVHRRTESLCRFDAVFIMGDDPKSQRIELVVGAFDVPRMSQFV